MPKTKVFAVRPDRLGGRLSAIVNAKRLADMFDLDLQVFWSKPKNAYPELVNPEHIFSTAFIDAHFLPEETPKGSLQFTPIPKKSAPITRAAFAARIAKGENFGFVTREGAVALPFEDLKSARVGFANAFQSLDFSPAFRVTMDHINGAVMDEYDYVAVHIRRGDVIRNKNTSEGFWHGQYVPDRIYFHALDALDTPDVRFVFFCDDAEVLAKYQARYTGALTAGEITDCADQPTLHADLAEMYLMSRCTRILGPRSSAFSMTAADLSGAICEPVEDLLRPEQMQQAVSELAQDIETGISAFHSVGDFKQALNALMKYHALVIPQMSLVDVVKSARKHDITTTHVLETTLRVVLTRGDLTPISWLETMVRQYDVHHVSALGESYAALAYAHTVQGNHTLAVRHLAWANWFYPESSFVSYLSSAIIGANGDAYGCLSPEIYGQLRACSMVPLHKGLRFLQQGPLQAQVNNLGQMKNHVAPFMVMDWLEFVNPKTRRRLQMRTSVPDDVTATLPVDLAAFIDILQSGSTSGMATLQNAAKEDNPLALKRLATGFFRIGDSQAGLSSLRDAVAHSNGNAAYLAALGIRLLEHGFAKEAVDIFDQLGAQDGNWEWQNPSVTYAHAQALFGVKAFAKSAEIIQRNLDFAHSCAVSNTLKRQLQKYL